MFQILLFLSHVNSTLTNLPLYGQLWHKFLLLFLFHFLSHLSVSLTLKPQSSPLKPHSVSLSPTPCFSRRRRPAQPRHLCAHQDADVRRRVLCLQRFDPVAHRARFLLRPRVHQDRAWESNHLPACHWCEFDF